MKCPFCQYEDTQVIDTRIPDDGDSVRRRRRCSHCDKRFTTYERIELVMPVVIKKDKVRVEFNREKLHASFMLALRKRHIAIEVIDMAVQCICEELRLSGAREVESDWIGELVMRELKKMDKVAYIRFASVYRNFEDVAEFQNAIEEFSP